MIGFIKKLSESPMGLDAKSLLPYFGSRKRVSDN
jgi:hypothetical protein